MDLTKVERLLLANQLKIMAALEIAPTNVEHDIEILESGYAYDYESVVGMTSEVEREVSEEVHDILGMFRALARRKADPANLSEDQKHWLTFNGFDGNHDDHYGYAKFLLQSLGQYAESAACPTNSHSQSTLPKYRAMLRTWMESKDRYDLTEEEIIAIVSSKA